MKTKNLIMAAAAFVFAIGGALAYTFSAQTVFVRARLTSGGTQQCVNTGVQCEETGTDICKVQITTHSGAQTATSSGPVYTFKSGCATVLKNNQDITLISAAQVYELIPGND